MDSRPNQPRVVTPLRRLAFDLGLAALCFAVILFELVGMEYWMYRLGRSGGTMEDLTTMLIVTGVVFVVALIAFAGLGIRLAATWQRSSAGDRLARVGMLVIVALVAIACSVHILRVRETENALAKGLRDRLVDEGMVPELRRWQSGLNREPGEIPETEWPAAVRRLGPWYVRLDGDGKTVVCYLGGGLVRYGISVGPLAAQTPWHATRCELAPDMFTWIQGGDEVLP